MTSLGQLAVMAALVATMAYFPFGLALIFVFHFAGIGFETLITFGGTLRIFVGLVAWWLLIFAGALVYAAFVFPWGDRALGRSKNKE